MLISPNLWKPKIASRNISKGDDSDVSLFEIHMSGKCENFDCANWKQHFALILQSAILLKYNAAKVNIKCDFLFLRA